MEDQKEGGREYTPETRDHRYGSQKICDRSLSMGDTFCGVHQSIGADHLYLWRIFVMIPYVQSAIFPATLITACRWSKQFAKKNILFISKVFTFEATPKFWGMEY